MIKFDITTASHIGGRAEQQDSVGQWTTDKTCLIIVADGVGGSSGGRAASLAIIRCATSYWEQCEGIINNPQEGLTELARVANQAILNLSNNEKRSPASTVVALYVDQTHAHWIHSGDSRLYWLRPTPGTAPEELSRTLDHSVVQMLLEQNKITEAEMIHHPDKNRIFRALGSNKFNGVDYTSREYTPGDTFLLCSDGYWESITPGEPILPPKLDNITMKTYAEQLVHEATRINGTDDSDNTTLAILRTSTAQHTARSEQSPAHTEKQPLKRVLMTILYLFIIFDIALIIYLFVLK